MQQSFVCVSIRKSQLAPLGRIHPLSPNTLTASRLSGCPCPWLTTAADFLVFCSRPHTGTASIAGAACWPLPDTHQKKKREKRNQPLHESPATASKSLLSSPWNEKASIKNTKRMLPPAFCAGCSQCGWNRNFCGLKKMENWHVCTTISSCASYATKWMAPNILSDMFDTGTDIVINY